MKSRKRKLRPGRAGKIPEYLLASEEEPQEPLRDYLWDNPEQRDMFKDDDLDAQYRFLMDKPN